RPSARRLRPPPTEVGDPDPPTPAEGGRRRTRRSLRWQRDDDPAPRRDRRRRAASPPAPALSPADGRPVRRLRAAVHAVPPGRDGGTVPGPAALAAVPGGQRGPGVRVRLAAPVPRPARPGGRRRLGRGDGGRSAGAGAVRV